MLRNNMNSFNRDTEFINLFYAPDAQIEEIKQQYSLHAPITFLREIGMCICAEQIVIDEEVLKFFDAIYLCSVSNSENIDISNVFTVDEEPIKTYSDLISKHKHLSDSVNNTISLSDATQTATKYLSTLDVCAPESVNVLSTDICSDLSFADSYGKMLLSLSIDEPEELPYGYKKSSDKEKSSVYLASPQDVFCVLTSELSNNAYKQKISELFSNEEFAKLCKFNTKIGIGGILSTVAHHSCGALVGNNTECSEKELCDYVNLYKDNFIIVSSKENLSVINSLASKYSLSLVEIATATNIPVYNIATTNKRINVNSVFLRNLFRKKTLLIPKIPYDSFEPMTYEPIHVNLDGETTKLDGTIEVKGHIFCAHKTAKCSFTSGINIVLNSVLTLLAKGISRKNIGITVKIGADSNHKSEAVASLLGVYRTAIELCIPEKESSIIDSEQNYIFCCAYAKEQAFVKETFLPAEPSCVHLLSFGRFNDTTPALMPDFYGIRKMCDFIEEMFFNKSILAAKAVDGSISLCSKEMCNNEVTLSPINNNGINENTKTQGIIIQVPINIKVNAPTLGVIRKG